LRGSGHFQLSDLFGQFDIRLGQKLLFEVAPVFAGPVTANQRLDCINDREPSFALVQDFSDPFAFEHSQSGCLFLAHDGQVYCRMYSIPGIHRDENSQVHRMATTPMFQPCMTRGAS
jgi:hypothetical protein